MKTTTYLHYALLHFFAETFCTASAQTQFQFTADCIKETYVYATKDTNTLRLDKYSLHQQSQNSPCVFFMFGGAFRGGVRDNKAYANYFNALVQRGYVVISIDYRLGMKDVKRFSSDLPLKKAIDMAVEDIYDATAFALKHAREWKIDTGHIIISGSSAGALSVLKAEYENDNRTALAGKLPANFRYAGVIAFAGAILSTNENDLTWANNKPCPILMFHGDIDKVVPYEHFHLGKAGIYGPRYIASKLDSLQTSYWLYTVSNGGHEVANTPMNKNHVEIFQFLDEMVLGKKNMVLQTVFKEPGNLTAEKKPSLEDFIKNNFQGR